MVDAIRTNMLTICFFAHRSADESSPGKEEKVTEERNTISAQRVECVETIGPTPETADVPPAAVNDHVIDNRRGNFVN